MKGLRVAALTVALAMGAGAASAAVYYATEVISADQNGTLASASRSDPLAVLGPVDGPAAGSFYALGLGGDLTVGFGRTFSGTTEIKLTEVTYLPTPRYGEAVDVFAVFGGADTLVGTLTNGQAQGGIGLIYTGMFDSLRFVDTTGTVFPTSPSHDGFDIDSIELTVAAVPVPLAAGLLLTGLASFGLVRTRRRPSKG